VPAQPKFTVGFIVWQALLVLFTPAGTSVPATQKKEQESEPGPGTAYDCHSLACYLRESYAEPLKRSPQLHFSADELAPGRGPSSETGLSPAEQLD
jgi:hypothetical protein